MLQTKERFGRKASFIILLLVLAVLSTTICLPKVRAASSNVSFNLEVSHVTGTFNVACSIGDTTVAPGGSVGIPASFSQGSSSLTLDLGTYGTHTVTFNTPIGTISIPVSGIPGASVNLDITGSITGSITTSGPASASPTTLAWESWGSKTVTIDATNAKDGDVIEATLSGSYSVSIGASVTLLGMTTNLFTVPMSNLSGSPSVTANIGVSSSPPIPWLYIFIAIIIVVIVAGSILYLRKRKPKTRVQPSAGSGGDVSQIPPARDMTPIPSPTVLQGVRAEYYVASDRDFCKVCNLDFVCHGVSDALRCPSCGSVFHHDCLSEFVKLNGFCPGCNRRMETI